MKRFGAAMAGSGSRPLFQLAGYTPEAQTLADVVSEAMVAKDYFSAHYDLDRTKRVFSHPDHALAGQGNAARNW